MTSISPSEKPDIRYEDTPLYLYPLAEKLSQIDRNWPIKTIFDTLVNIIKYLIKYHDMDDACDFYEALRRSTFEENIFGTYFRSYKRLIRHKFYANMTRKRVLVDRRILEQIPLLIIGYFIENKLSDRVISENK